MLANLALLVELNESAMHHGGYKYSEKCLKLLFILLPDYKASKLSFICGETVTTSTTPAMTTSTTAGVFQVAVVHTALVRIAAAIVSTILLLLLPTLYIDFCLTLMNIFCGSLFYHIPISVCALECIETQCVV